MVCIELDSEVGNKANPNPNHFRRFKMAKFENGKTYSTRDGENFTVIKRTAKRLFIESQFTPEKMVGVKVDEKGIEWALPHGRYSMAPVITATRTI